MAKSYRIAVIGIRDAILPFKMLGFDIYPVISGSEAAKQIAHLASEANYGVIFITEDLAQEIKGTISQYDAQTKPAIILIPTHMGSLGIGMDRIKENVDKAIGANIL